MTKDSEVNRTMADLIAMLSPSYTDEEQVPAKQVQRGYNSLQKQMRTQGRLVVTVHGHPEAVLLPYQSVKMLSKLVSDLIEQSEDKSLLLLAAERLRNQRDERIPLEQGLADMREVFFSPTDGE